ncbi:MAG: hypothetical protein C4330_11430 [Chitinophagaceae bacterium]
MASIKELLEYLVQHRTSFNAEVFLWFEELITKLTFLQTTADKFAIQLRHLFSLTPKAEDNTELQERIKTAAGWFGAEIKTLTDIIVQSPAVTDSAMHAKEYNEQLKEVFVLLSQQSFLLGGFTGKFDVEVYHRRKKAFVTPAFNVNAYAGASDRKVELAHPALYYQLKKLSDTICARRNVPIYYVASSKTLEEMTLYLPQTAEELQQISGFGKAKVEAYGTDVLSIIQECCAENGLVSAMAIKEPKKKRKEPKKDTKTESLRLYNEGKAISDIAKERNLSVQTVEGHLAHYVQTGAIEIDTLISKEKIALIEPELKNYTGTAITPIKEKLGSSISFGEIKLVQAWLNRTLETEKQLK